VFPLTAAFLSFSWRIKGKILITVVTIELRHVVSEAVGYHASGAIEAKCLKSNETMQPVWKGKHLKQL